MSGDASTGPANTRMENFAPAATVAGANTFPEVREGLCWRDRSKESVTVREP